MTLLLTLLGATLAFIGGGALGYAIGRIDGQDEVIRWYENRRKSRAAR